MPPAIQGRAYDRREAYLNHYVDAFMNNAEVGILLSESTQATTPLPNHENFSGNCFDNAVVSVSAMI
jgi:hypothetical protein